MISSALIIMAIILTLMFSNFVRNSHEKHDYLLLKLTNFQPNNFLKH